MQCVGRNLACHQLGQKQFARNFMKHPRSCVSYVVHVSHVSINIPHVSICFYMFLHVLQVPYVFTCFYIASILQSTCFYRSNLPPIGAKTICQKFCKFEISRNAAVSMFMFLLWSARVKLDQKSNPVLK